jgi:hypothetical protein
VSLNGSIHPPTTKTPRPENTIIADIRNANFPGESLGKWECPLPLLDFLTMYSAY